MLQLSQKEKLTGHVELKVPAAEAGGRDLVPGPAGEDGGEVGLGGADVELGQARPVRQPSRASCQLVGENLSSPLFTRELMIAII